MVTQGLGNPLYEHPFYEEFLVGQSHLWETRPQYQGRRKPFYNPNNRSNNFRGNNTTSELNNTINITQTSNQDKNTSSSSTNRNFLCYRCNQPGHTVRRCPYSYKQLAEMEEQGLLNKPLN